MSTHAVDDPAIAAFVRRHGPGNFTCLCFLAAMIVRECEADRYEWAAFWRDEAKYLFGGRIDA